LSERFHKPFEGDIHSVTDKPGRDLVATFLSNQGADVRPHPDDYDIDLQVFKPGTDILIAEAEVEVRVSWTDHEYMEERWGPYLHVPTRKEKFLDGDVPFMFFSINRNLTGMLWCFGKTIKESRIGRNMKQKKYFNEKFFKVEWTKMNWTDLQAEGIQIPDYEQYLRDVDELERAKGWGKYKHA
jgi:hypothetical protein